MKKLISFLFIIINTALFASDAIIPSKINEYVQGVSTPDIYILRKSFKTNLLNSGMEEYITFYYYNNSFECFFNKIVIYAIDNKKIINSYQINEKATFNYTKNDTSIIKSVESILGPWNGYYYSYDLNQNGINELFIFRYTGHGMTLAIYEFSKNCFQPLMIDVNARDPLVKIMIDVSNKSIILFETYEWESHQQGYRKNIYTWNSTKKIYELIKEENGVSLQ